MKTLLVAMVVHQAEEGGFWASFPELPGCFTQGETLEELRNNAREAVGGHLAGLQDKGEPIPEPVVTVESVLAELRA
jgi:predicted RNase H-like HicB family nuclease